MLIFGLLLAGYVFLRAILPLCLRWRWKIVLSVLLLLTAFKFHVLHFMGGPMFFSPSLPRPVLLLSAWLFAVLFFFFFALVIADAARGIYFCYVRCVLKKKTDNFRKNSNRANLLLLIVCAVLATIGIIEGTRVPSVREKTVFLKDLPAEADGMTIAVLTDIHVDSMTRANHVRKIVERTNEAQPDIIVLVGDFVDGTVETFGKDVAPLRELSARYGIFGVPGNHEYYSGYREWNSFLSGLGIRMLNNENAILDGKKVAVAGVTDPAASRRGEVLPDIIRALEGVPRGFGKILLAHQPRLATGASEQGVDLQISGHTHGGLVLGIDRIVAGANAGFVSGLYEVGDMSLYVSNGSGIWNGFPIRVGVPSEITLLRLRRK